ncbi:MAG: hypothetical protein IOD12_16185 [Silvanigrellales bacterium]|nr:hypothetical protein [Silvanigrellales bacterium]
MNIRSASGRVVAVTIFLLSALLVGSVAASCSLIANSRFNLERQKAWLGSEPVSLRQGWQYRWGDDVAWAREPADAPGWTSFSFPGQAPGRNGRESLWLSFPLPSKSIEDPTLFFLAMDSNFEVWIDGARQFAFGDLNGPRRSEFRGYPWFLVPLPPGAEGKTVFLRVQSTHDNIGPYGEVFVGSRAAQVARIVRTDVPKFTIGSVFAIAGLGLLFLYARRRQERMYFGFALVCITLGLYLVCRTSLKQLFLFAPVPWFVAELVCFFFLPLGVSQFTDVIFGRNALTWATRVASLYAVIALLAAATGVVTLTDTLFPFQILFILCILVFIWEVVKRLGRDDLDPKVLAVGFLCLGISGVHDVLLAMGFMASSVEMSHWGLLGVVGSMSAITVRRFADVYLRMEATTRDLAVKSGDLEQRNGDLVRMSEELGRVAVKLGDRLNTPLEVMLLASEEIEDHVEERFKGLEDAELRKEIAHLFEVFRRSTETIRTELKSLQPFKKYAPQNSVDEDLSLPSFESRVSTPPK